MANNRKVLDLGCGKNKEPGAIGVDNVALDTVDVIHDLLDFPYPFENESIDEVILSHVLEHFVLDDIIKILNEAGRILKKEGVVTISVPHVYSPVAFTDPGHKTFFTYQTLYYFTKGHAASYRRDLKLKNDWEIKKIWTSVNITSDRFVKVTKFRQKLSNLSSKILNFLLRNSKSMTLPELIVKLSPFWLVSIHAKLHKLE